MPDIKYRVEYQDERDATVKTDAKDLADARNKARNISRRKSGPGSAYAVAVDGENKSIGHIAYFNGIRDRQEGVMI